MVLNVFPILQLPPIQETGLKKLTPKQMFQRSPIALSQVNSGHIQKPLNHIFLL